MSLLLTDGPDGPVLRTLRDVPEAPAALNPPTLTMPASGSAVDKTKAKTPAIERSDGRRIAVVLCVAAIMGAAVLMARARPTRRPGQQNDAALHEAVRARGAAVRWFAAHDRLTTLRDYLGGSLSLRFRRGGRDSRTMLHCTKRCGRAGAAVRWFAAHVRLTTLRA